MRKSGGPFRRAVRHSLIRQQSMGVGLAMNFGIGVIDALNGDRERAAFGFSYPALFLQIPEVKLQMFRWTAQHALQRQLADARIGDVLPASDLKDRQDLVLNVGVRLDGFFVARFLEQFPADARLVFVFDVVLRAFTRIVECIMGLHDDIETRTIAGFVVIGMVKLSEIAKHPLYRSRVGVRADFQDFVVVDEVRRFHRMPPCGPSQGQCVTQPLKAFLSFRGLRPAQRLRETPIRGTISTGQRLDGFSAWRAQPLGSRLELNDGANGAPAAQIVKAAIDVLKTDAAGDQLIKL
jgi:hypothetical protein